MELTWEANIYLKHQNIFTLPNLANTSLSLQPIPSIRGLNSNTHLALKSIAHTVCIPETRRFSMCFSERMPYKDSERIPVSLHFKYRYTSLGSEKSTGYKSLYALSRNALVSISTRWESRPRPFPIYKRCWRDRDCHKNVIRICALQVQEAPLRLLSSQERPHDCDLRNPTFPNFAYISH